MPRLRIARAAFLLFVAMISSGNVMAADPVRVDGTSHLNLLTRAWVQAAQDVNYRLKVTNEESGSGAGFKHFTLGQLDIIKSSRPMKDGERTACQNAGIQTIEVPTARFPSGDAKLRFVVNRKSLHREEVRGFLRYCLSDHAQELAAVHAVPLRELELNDARLIVTMAIQDDATEQPPENEAASQ